MAVGVLIALFCSSDTDTGTESVQRVMTCLSVRPVCHVTRRGRTMGQFSSVFSFAVLTDCVLPSSFQHYPLHMWLRNRPVPSGSKSQRLAGPLDQ